MVTLEIKKSELEVLNSLRKLLQAAMDEHKNSAGDYTGRNLATPEVNTITELVHGYLSFRKEIV